MDLLEELKDLAAVFDSEGIEYGLCGGLAMAVYARPRATLDIDILVELGSLFRAVRAAGGLGFTVSGAPMEFNAGRIRLQRLCKLDAASGEYLCLDLLVADSEVRQVWENRLKVEWEGGVLCVVSPAGLIALKSLRGTGQDQDDIDYLRSIADED